MKYLVSLKEAYDFITSDEGRRSCVITDPRLPDNPIVYVTPEFERQTGYTRHEVLGRNCRFLQGPDTDPETVERIRQALWEMQPVEVEILNYRKDGTPFMNAISIRPCFGPAGDLKSFVSVQAGLGEIAGPLPRNVSEVRGAAVPSL